MSRSAIAWLALVILVAVVAVDLVLVNHPECRPIHFGKKSTAEAALEAAEQPLFVKAAKQLALNGAINIDYNAAQLIMAQSNWTPSGTNDARVLLNRWRSIYQSSHQLSSPTCVRLRVTDEHGHILFDEDTAQVMNL